ncbi:MAG TPA: substrate-binding domain-containing protein [Terriglobales bacterium]|jgi:molybdate transport system substrate-binding protein|nr:substrate-binding domain-containing protein [Terriglobales bacterium]
MTSPAEIRVLSSLAHREAYLELVPQFERSTGHRTSTTWAGTVDIMKRLGAGEPFDLVIVSSASIDELIDQGKIAGARTDLAKTGIGVAIGAGMAKPDISSADALKRVLLAAKTVGYSTGPSGAYLVKLFERMGIAEQVKHKTRQVPSGGTVATILANGVAEIGFQQVSELMHVPGVDFVGPLPAEVQHVTLFSCGIPTGAKSTAAARELVRFLTAPSADAVFKKHGLERP